MRWIKLMALWLSDPNIKETTHCVFDPETHPGVFVHPVHV